MDDSTEVDRIGTVEVLVVRIYPSDPDKGWTDGDDGVAVKPGGYPVLRRDGHVWWEMHGRTNRREVVTQDLPHEGMFTLTAYDRPGLRRTTVRSPLYDAEDFAALLTEPVATEGHPEQRLRFHLTTRP